MDDNLGKPLTWQQNERLTKILDGYTPEFKFVSDKPEAAPVAIVVDHMSRLRNAVDEARGDGDNVKATRIAFGSNVANMYGDYTAVELREIADQLVGEHS